MDLCARVVFERWSDDARVAIALNFASDTIEIRPKLTNGSWRRVLDSSHIDWRGPGGSLPDELDGGDGATIELPAHGAAIYEWIEPPETASE